MECYDDFQSWNNLSDELTVLPKTVALLKRLKNFSIQFCNIFNVKVTRKTNIVKKLKHNTNWKVSFLDQTIETTLI